MSKKSQNISFKNKGNNNIIRIRKALRSPNPLLHEYGKYEPSMLRFVRNHNHFSKPTLTEPNSSSKHPTRCLLSFQVLECRYYYYISIHIFRFELFRYRRLFNLTYITWDICSHSYPTCTLYILGHLDLLEFRRLINNISQFSRNKLG
jgi:hypothetical protein